MAGPTISVIMVDGGFREGFRALGSWLEQSLPADRYELVWVDYTDRVAPEVASNARIRSFALGRRDEPQVLGVAYNRGIAEARGELLVIADGDVACEPDLLETVEREHARCDDLVLYVLRLDQPERLARPDWDLDHLRSTCTVKHTYNFGGCTTVRRKWMVEMNGFEQLPFFAGYHYLGGDNYIRFKNRGLKVMWHPAQRVYHPWHALPPGEKFGTVPQMEALIRRRAATWDWLAYDGLDPARNRRYDPAAPVPSDWARVQTEYGGLVLRRDPLAARGLSLLRQRGPLGALRHVVRRAFGGRG